jgi:chromosome segregation ATPase
MAAIVFDVREAERRMRAAGASQELAEATADLMSKAVLSNLDALVTKDYLDARLDARFGPIESRLDRLEFRFDQLESRFDQLESRFGQLESRFGQLDMKFRDIDARFEGVDARFNQLRTEMMGSFRLIHALLAIVMAGVFIPQFQAWFGS